MNPHLFVLAFDHRESFLRAFFGVTSEPSEADRERASRAKDVIWSGLERALDEVDPSTVGVLVDATYARRVIDAARTRGIRYAIPLEESGRDELTLETSAWRERLAELDPSWAKILVRYNPEGDAGLNERQRRILAEVSEHCRTTGRAFMLEVLVPAVPGQLRVVGDDPDRYDHEIRPALVARAIEEMQATGIEPDVWKLEGLDDRAACEAVASAARADGRVHVGCVVLGRGADDLAVEHWVRTAAGVEGWTGFAIGRSIWWEPLRGYFDGGEDDAARRSAEAEIAGTFARYARLFLTSASRR